MMQDSNCRSRTSLLRTVEKLSFAADDAALYLDNYPNCKKAIAYYNDTVARLKEAVALYEASFGPLTRGSVESCDSWLWTKGPWPWQIEFYSDGGMR